MSQKNWDNIAISILLFSIVADLIALFAWIRAKRQGREQEKSDEATKKDIQQLHNELNLLKIQLAQIIK